MKHLKLFALFVAFVFISCERDDICAESTETTPRLLIEFYDAANPDDLKNVPRLTLHGEGLVIAPIVANDATLIFNSNENSVQLPLEVSTEGEVKTIRFILEKNTNLRLDDDDATASNTDFIDITYTPEFVYVSRACGYKSIFTGLDVAEDLTDPNPWINSIVIDERTIENENTVHVRIFH